MAGVSARDSDKVISPARLRPARICSMPSSTQGESTVGAAEVKGSCNHAAGIFNREAAASAARMESPRCRAKKNAPTPASTSLDRQNSRWERWLGCK